MLEFGILGPLTVHRAGTAIDVPTGRARTLLGALLVRRGAVVSVDELVFMVWGETPPRTVATALHGHVSRLRRALGERALITTPPGYTVVAEPSQLDSERFLRMVARAHAEVRASGKSAQLRAALALWRGLALADFCYEPFAQSDIAALEEARLAAHEDAIEADLNEGRYDAVVSELQALVRRHPLRERLRGHLMMALYRDGRQAEALVTYRDARRRIVDELGVEPGPALRELQSAILRQDVRLSPMSAVRNGWSGTDPPLVRRFGRDDAEFIGRAAEIDRLDAALQRVASTFTPTVQTIIGEAGIGKSRLARTFVARIRDGVTVLTGQCRRDLRATYAPLRDMLAQLPADPDEPGGPTDPAVVELRRVMSGNEAMPSRLIDAAAIKLFTHIARRRPAVLVVEDVHWAQPALLDLLESVSANANSAVMILCLARPELTEIRPAFGQRVPEAGTLELGPMTPGEIRRVVSDLTVPGAKDQTIDDIVSVAHGNPLFALQLVAWAGETTGSPSSAPPALRALLADRIGRLGPGELLVVQCAAIVGRAFNLDSVIALLPVEAHSTVERHLHALARRQIVRRTVDGHEFRHDLLLRAVYLSLDTSKRARLHQEYADWLSSDPRIDPAVFDEVIGYHLEQAHDSEQALGTELSRARELGLRAAEHLAAAARRAADRMDVLGASGLFARALRLLPRDDPRRPALMLDACRPLRLSGRVEASMTMATEATELAHAAGEVAVEWRARLEAAFVRAFVTGDRVLSAARQVAEQAVTALTPLADHDGLTYAWLILGQTYEGLGEPVRAGAAFRRARYHARRSPHTPNGGQIAWGLADSMRDGPTPVRVAIARTRELAEWRGNVIPGVLLTLAELHALNANPDEARIVLKRGEQVYGDWGSRRSPIYIAQARSRVELLAGDAAAAEVHAREGLKLGASVGGDETDGANALVLAHSLCQQQRFDEADAVTATYSGETTKDDLARIAAWNALRAWIRVHRGSWAEAADLAGQAISAVEGTDLVNLRAELRLALAAALSVSGDGHGAHRIASEALRLFEAKGNLVGLADARRFLSRL